MNKDSFLQLIYFYLITFIAESFEPYGIQITALFSAIDNATDTGSVDPATVIKNGIL